MTGGENRNTALDRLRARGAATAAVRPAADDLYTGDSGRMFIVAALVSLMLHAALAITVYDRPIGVIDPELIEEERPMRIRRADTDLIVDAQPAGLSQQQGVVDLTLLSKTMLEAPPSLERARTPQPVSPEVGRVPEVAAGWPGSFTKGHPAVTLPRGVQQEMLGQVDGGLMYQPEAPAGPSGTSTVEARGALEGRLVLRRPPDPVMARPRIDDRPQPRFEERMPTRRVPRPVVDLSQQALADTTRLAVPEHLDDDFEYTLSTYTHTPGRGLFAARGPEDTRGYFRLDIRGKQSLRKLRTMPKDVVFLVDTSGSVSQDWVDKVRLGVRDGLAMLNAGDRFNIVLFKDSPAFFSTQGIVPFNEQTLAAATTFIREARSGGYTDVNAALTRLLVRDVDPNRVYNLVLISDGLPTKGVMDTRELLNLVTRDNALAASIYCVGIGARQNRELLEFLAYRNKGFCLFVPGVEEARGTLRGLMSRIRFPIIKDVQLSVVGVDSASTFPLFLPNIHQGEQFSVFGRFDRPGTFTARITGSNGAQPLDLTVIRDLGRASPGDEPMMQDWAFWKLHHLYSQMLRMSDDTPIRREIEKLTREYRIKALY